MRDISALEAKYCGLITQLQEFPVMPPKKKPVNEAEKSMSEADTANVLSLIEALVNPLKTAIESLTATTTELKNSVDTQTSTNQELKRTLETQ